MNEKLVKHARLARRVRRVRKRVIGTSQRPRLCVARFNRNIYAQIIDDMAGNTLCALSSAAKEIRAQHPNGGNSAAAAAVGKIIGEKARALGISEVCFDRRGRRFHGRIKALADAAREAGLKF